MIDSIAVMAPGQRVLDANGDPVSGAKLKFFDAGTSDPKTVHSDSGLSVALGTTVHCDSGGYPVSSQGSSTKTQVYVGDSAFKLIITDSNDVTIATHDNIKGAIDTESFAPEFSKAKEPVVSLTSSRAAATTDYGKLIQANSTAGSITYSLPAAATAGDGTRVRVRHVGTAGTVSIVASGSETIDGPQGASNSYQLTTYGNEVLLICTGAGWVASAFYIADGSVTAAQLSSAISGTFMQTGSIIIWPDTTTPTGYLDCDGAAVSRTTYSELFAVIGTKYGPGDGSTTFNLPNYAGYFLRGLDGGAGADPDAATRTDRGDGTTGDNVGTLQDESYKSHTHANTLTDPGHDHDEQTRGAGAGADFTALAASGPSGSTSVDSNTTGITINNVASGGNETRGKNAYVRFLIFSGASAATGASATLHTLLHGSGAPNDALGNNDDFYIDVDSYAIYGPKASGSWSGTGYRFAFVAQGAWATSTAYVVNDVVTNSGSSYVCILDHTSSGTDEPGVGANTATYWQLLASKGNDGVAGTAPGIAYTFSTDTTTTSDPGTGNLELNNATLSSVTEIALDDNSSATGNPDVSAWLATLDDSTSSTKGQLLIKKASAPENFAIYEISSTTDATTHYRVTVTHVDSAGSFSASDALSVEFKPRGDAGSGAVTSVFGRSGAVVAANSDYDITQIDFSASDRIAGRATSGAGLAEELTAAQVRTIINVADGATANSGDLVAANNLSDVSNAATAFDNIKQVASETATGVVELATASEYRDNTSAKALSTDKVWSAMAEVTLTDAATIALDLATGFDFTVTLGGNRTLENPTNVKVGQRGRMRVVQDGTGSRTLSFASNYEHPGGTAPTLSTGANDEDVIYFDCISSTRVLILSALDIS